MFSVDMGVVTAGVRLSNAVEVVAQAAANDPASEPLSPATVRWLRVSMGRLVATIGDMEVEALSAHQVGRWHQGLLRKVSAVTANNYLRAIKITYSRLQKLGVTGVDPAGPVAYAREPAPRIASVSKQDYLAMRAVAATEEGCMGVRDMALLDVLWSSGVRLGGLLSMRVDRMDRWLDEAGRICFAFYVIEKGNKPRWAYVDKGRMLAQWLECRPETSPYVWLSARRPVRPLAASSVESLMRRLRLGAGIPAGRPTNPHAFRHAFAKRRLLEGASLAQVSRWLGHASAEFTADVYMRFGESELRESFFRH